MSFQLILLNLNSLIVLLSKLPSRLDSFIKIMQYSFHFMIEIAAARTYQNKV